MTVGPCVNRESCASRDRALLESARNGDPDAFSELFRTHWAKAVMIARGRCRQPADAADIAALAFERIIVALRNGGGPTTTFDGYLRVTIGHLASRHSQSEQVMVPVFDLSDTLLSLAGSDSGQSPVLSELIDPTLIGAIGGLNDHQRRLLWMVDVVGYTATDLAAQCGLTPNTVAAQVCRARRRLRMLYESAAPDAAFVA